jgi:hypothetical protein
MEPDNYDLGFARGLERGQAEAAAEVARLAALNAELRAALDSWQELWRDFPGRSCREVEWNAWVLRRHALAAADKKEG